MVTCRCDISPVRGRHFYCRTVILALRAGVFHADPANLGEFGPMRKLLDGYPIPDGRYDELLAGPGTPRPHWDAFLRSLAARQGPEVSDTLSLMEREIRENGITYNVYADPKGADRPWQGRPPPPPNSTPPREN